MTAAFQTPRHPDRSELTFLVRHPIRSEAEWSIPLQQFVISTGARSRAVERPAVPTETLESAGAVPGEAEPMTQGGRADDMD
jgi:hypothetical protein